MEAVSFQNIRMSAKEGILLSDARNITLEDVVIDTNVCPAMSCHNVRGLSMTNTDVSGPVEKVDGHLGDL